MIKKITKPIDEIINITIEICKNFENDLYGLDIRLTQEVYHNFGGFHDWMTMFEHKNLSYEKACSLANNLSECFNVPVDIIESSQEMYKKEEENND